MATTIDDDDFDMPELTDEMLMEFKPLTELAHTDLHMGAAVVRPFKKPAAKPLDLSGMVIDAVIGTMCLAAAWLFVQVWIWVLFN
jgi:hypothetical protein